jgi:hypothetical protein
MSPIPIALHIQKHQTSNSVLTVAPIIDEGSSFCGAPLDHGGTREYRSDDDDRDDAMTTSHRLDADADAEDKSVYLVDCRSIF